MFLYSNSHESYFMIFFRKIHSQVQLKRMERVYSLPVLASNIVVVILHPAPVPVLSNDHLG
jgi:hypothetical protein